MLNIDPEQLGELLSGYLDGELGGRDTQIVETWLRDNAEVRKQFEALRRTVTSVQALPRHAPPPELADDLLAQLERHDLLDDVESVNPVKPVRAFPWVSALAAVAVVGVVALVGFQQFGSWGTDAAPGSARVADAGHGVPTEASATHESALLQSESPGLDPKPLQTQLEAGTTTDAVRNHAFAAETVRLSVSLPKSGSAADAMNRIVAHLADAKILNVSKVRRRPLTLSSGAFFLPGVRGVNFEDAQAQQVLVRLPSEALDELLDLVERESPTTASVKLLAGSLQFDGLDNARHTLALQDSRLAMSSESDARSRRSARRRERRTNHVASRAVAPKDRTSAPVDDPGFADLLETLGIPGAALGENAPARAGELTDELAAARKRHEASPELSEPATPSTSFKKPTATEAKAMANQPMAVSGGDDPTNRTGAAPAGVGSPATEPDRYVTMVLEFREPPAPSAPPTRPTNSKR